MREILGVLLAALFAAGCSSTPDEGSTEVRLTVNGSLRPQTSSTAPLYKGLARVEGIVTDERGRQWHARRVTEFASNDAPPPKDAVATERVDEEALSDEEYADRYFKNAMLVVDPDGVEAWQYVAVTADIDAARQARAKKREHYRLHLNSEGKLVEEPDERARTLSRSLARPPVPDANSIGSPIPEGFGFVPLESRLLPLPEARRVQDEQERNLLDYYWSRHASNLTDPNINLGINQLAPAAQLYNYNRQMVPWTSYTSWPGRASVSITQSPAYNDDEWRFHWPLAVPDGCSGTMIGVRTMLSAAHCFYTWQYYGNDSRNWKYMRSFAIGVVQQAGQQGFMYVYPPFRGGYAVSVMNVYDSSAPYDFAVVDWYAGQNPGSTSGWVWPGYSSNSFDYNYTPGQMQGYDSFGGGTIPGDNNFSYPSMITRSTLGGTMNIDYYDNRVLDHALDTGAGSSGAGVVMPLFMNSYGDPTWYLGATNNKGDWPQNRAVTMNPTLWAYVRDFSPEYP